VSHGVSGIVAAALALLIVVMVFGFMLIVLNQYSSVQRQLVRQIAQRELLREELERGLILHFYVNTSNSKGLITVENTLPAPVTLKTLLLVFSDWTAYYYDEAVALKLITPGTTLLVCDGVATALPTPDNVVLNPGCSLSTNFTYARRPVLATALASIVSGAQHVSAYVYAQAVSAVVAAVPPTGGAPPAPTATATTTTTTTTPPPTLTLVHRYAIAWDNFTSNPFTSGRLNAVTNTFTWLAAPYYAIEQNSTSTGLTSSGENYAYANLAAYNPGYPVLNSTKTPVVYLLAAIMPTYSSNWHDLLLYNTSTRYFYEFSMHFNSSGTYLEIWRWNGSWLELSSTPVSFNVNVWYVELVRYEYASGRLALAFYGPLQSPSTTPLAVATASSTSITPTTIGFGDWGATSRWAWFVLSANATPLYVNVSGLQPGWNVTLYYNGSKLVASALADSSGVAHLYVARMPIIPNAVFKIYTGTTTYTFTEPLVVGGDLWRFG